MKVQLTYPQLKALAFRFAQTLPDDCQLVAISRGGLTFAHLVAYFTAKPLGFFIPKTKQLVLAGSGPLVFLEDLIAKGRTLELVRQTVTQDWTFACVVLDSRFDIPAELKARVTYMMRTADWVVFPHEEFDAVVEEDWGLFREQTSANSKPVARPDLWERMAPALEAIRLYL